MSSDWAIDSNEALHLSLVRAQEEKAVLSKNEVYEDFRPTFTYPIYGEDEKIYGYKDLAIDLRFASGSLSTYLGISYSAKLPSPSPVDDVEATLAEFIPAGYIQDLDKFLEVVETDAVGFKPLGKKIHSYTRPSRSPRPSQGAASGSAPSSSDDAVEYEVYHSTWGTEGFREYHRKMQLFILLYIEGGSYIQEEEETWEFVVLYEKRTRRSDPSIETYHFVGYSSLYPFYCFPEKVRLRLSQFVIVPPFQHAGHGSALYTAIYQYVLSQPNIAELTVEDPAEAFEDLRDRNDLRMLLGLDKFMMEGFGESSVAGGADRHRKGKGKKRQGKMGPPVERGWAEKWRVDLKIAGRQFSRLVEMLQLRSLDETEVLAMKAYRLQVKERLYRFNFEALMQLEKEDRQQKLEETFQSVCNDYQRILAMIQ
ncbi:histone acetyltransferase type B catalytic subunit [Irpex rosettiformis]|uniref:Histone acetyltransferase type B catalytic subunit n=1 Tax=Irpex rosettiformis TaxID=378272 RepID=A0ACB8UJ48_9APHY|nr:histone acetyltransferase type B catalytic subunit [Irpex rosettiformis]